ncbi:MAG: FtsX-like permease family protein [Eubacteriales bacterium]|nr:FtsX-like permease family protein [Eubacteriales bacterium]
MLQFVLRKLLHKRWMALCLLIGNILLVSISSCNPMYTEAVLQRMLMSNMNDYISETNRYPGTITLTGTANKRNDEVANLDKFLATRDLAADLPEMMGVEAVEEITHYYVDAVRLVPDVPRRENDMKATALGFLTDMPEHIELIAGRCFAPGINENGCYELIISQSAMADLDLLLGERFTAYAHTGPQGEPLRFEIVGVYTFSSAEDVYWVRTPTSYRNECFLSEEDFRYLFGDMDALRYSLTGYWYSILDYEQMRGENVAAMNETRLAVREQFDITGYRYYDNFGEIFEDYLVKAEKVNVTLLVLQVPIFVLLASFIFMVSRQMLEMEQSEISILKSRGAGKGQIIGVYLLQSTLLALVGFGVGIPTGMWLCQVLGSANAFLEFVSRRALDVQLDAQALLMGALAALFSVATMVLPVLRFSNVSIVNQKQQKHRRSDAPMWQKLYLDFILLGVALYGLYSFNGQKDILAQRVADGASLDPLLFLCSSLFILGAGLVAVRVVPMLVWLIFSAFKGAWSPAMYASFLRVLRTKKSQGFIMVFLVMTIALGMFNAQAARTINGNEEDRIRYLSGADIVLREEWEDNSEQAGDSSTGVMYEEPDFDRYTTLEGVASATKVLYNDSGIISAGSGGQTLKGVHIMGIHTKEFGETIRFKDGLLPHHINEYLNAISQNTNAVLVSKNFADNLGYKLGDVINYKCELGNTVRGVIYGFVEYWPTYNAVTTQIGTDGRSSEVNQYLIVAHLSTLQAKWGVTPYEVWIRAEDGTRFFHDFVQEQEISYYSLRDTSQQLVELKNDPIFQGTNGIFTVGFIVVLLLCTVGFLIYWILSIQSRSLQFGIFRAMGMSLREIISMLLNEQVFISGMSIATGALVGQLASRLFIPLIQISYAPADEVIPLSVISDSADTLRLFGVVGVVMLLCLLILGVLISRIKIAQALKLGED